MLTGLLGTTATAASSAGIYPFTLGTLTAGANYTLALSASPPTFAVTQANGPMNLASNDADFDRMPGLTRYAPA